jgi:hypothetical protein
MRLKEVDQFLYMLCESVVDWTVASCRVMMVPVAC